MKVLLATLVLVAASIQAQAAQPLPDDSIHHLTSTFTDAKGAGFKLVDRRGTVQIVTMFYSSCAYACPLIVESVKAIDRALTEDERKKLALLLVSFDPARDTVPALQKMAKERHVELPRWTLARAEAPDVRKLAAMLDVRYRQLEDGEFNHTNVLALVDAEGRVVARTEAIGPTPDPEFLAKVKETLAKRGR